MSAPLDHVSRRHVDLPAGRSFEMMPQVSDLGPQVLDANPLDGAIRQLRNPLSAPLNHVSRRYDRICVPPDGKPQLVCDLWPECMCDADCIDRSDAILMRRVGIILIAATLAIVAGLMFWAMRS